MRLQDARTWAVPLPVSSARAEDDTKADVAAKAITHGSFKMFLLGVARDSNSGHQMLPSPAK